MDVGPGSDLPSLLIDELMLNSTEFKGENRTLRLKIQRVIGIYAPINHVMARGVGVLTYNNFGFSHCFGNPWLLIEVIH